MRKQSKPITNDLLRNQALKLYETQFSDIAEKFSALDGWIKNFRKRYGIVMRRKTHNQTVIDKDFKIEVNESSKKFKDLVERNKYNINSIANMDETPLYYENNRSTTLERKAIILLVE